MPNVEVPRIVCFILLISSPAVLISWFTSNRILGIETGVLTRCAIVCYPCPWAKVGTDGSHSNPRSQTMPMFSSPFLAVPHFWAECVCIVGEFFKFKLCLVLERMLVSSETWLVLFLKFAISKAHHLLLDRNRRAAWVRAEIPLLAGLRKSNALPPANERGKVKPLVNTASQRRASVWKENNLSSSSYLGFSV